MKQFFLQLLILITFCNYSHLSELPTTEDFLTWLFNCSKDEVDEVVNEFKFLPDVSKKYIHFYYYVPNSDNKTIEISAQNASTVLDKSKNLVVIIHGWRATAKDSWLYAMANEYYRNKKLPVNVVGLDWSEYSYKDYVSSAGRIQALGKNLAEFVRGLAKHYPKISKKLHLVGHSLGAHVAGFAGQFLKKANMPVNRITGLDAAAPLFDYPVLQKDSSKLSKDDARYVSLIHTSINFIGVTLPHGRTDFFVNLGGPVQPQCVSPNIIDAFTCSHTMSTEYFLNTINEENRYWGVACKNPDIANLDIPDSCNNKKKALMGEFTSHSVQGIYYVFTNVTET